VTDGAGDYGHHENCVIKALQPQVVAATKYDVEGGNSDFLTVAGTKYKDPKNGPEWVSMASGEEVVWKSDHRVSKSGFMLCTTPLPFHPLGPLFEIVEGASECEITDGGRCVQDKGRAGKYKYCLIKTLQVVTVHTERFAFKESPGYYDFLRVGDDKYKYGYGVPGAHLLRGEELEFMTENEGNGFKVCAIPAAGFWEIVSGAQFCQITDGGRCVSAGGGTNERCKIKTLRPMLASTEYGDITVAGGRYSAQPMVYHWERLHAKKKKN